MTEYEMGFAASASVLGLAASCLLYMIGGRRTKIIRRLGAAFVLAATVNAAAAYQGLWDGRLMLIFPALFAGFSTGYGGDALGVKLLRRTIYTLAVCGSGFIFVWVLGGKAWWVFIPHVGVGAWGIYLALKGVVHAASEEVFVCLLLNAGLIMYPFIR